MSEHDLGAYAPPTADAPLSFDARHPVRGARPFPATLVISGLVLLGLVVAIFLFYRSGVREAGQAPKTIGTPVAEMKSAPPADAQPQDPAAGLQIYQTEGGQPQGATQPNFVAPPEQPTARPEPSFVAPPQAAPTTPVAAASTLRPALPPAPPPPAALTPQPAPKPVQIKPVAPPPAKAAAVKPLPVKPAPVKAAASEAASAKPAAPARTAGVAAVQIGAVSSTALADKAWNDAVGLAPGLAAGKGKGVERIEKDGHVLYRTAVTGFASRTDAAAFCAKLKAAGKACFVK
ncbi:SPOR domain-containing protein [Phenylobacterium sp. LjRoot225]|uniref:cell division protein FtsN n=1 Tax=Phenylobacterium sp. LjRoot225 TaxID=3342285 RepID=UPI003ECF6389